MPQSCSLDIQQQFFSSILAEFSPTKPVILSLLAHGRWQRVQGEPVPITPRSGKGWGQCEVPTLGGWLGARGLQTALRRFWVPQIKNTIRYCEFVGCPHFRPGVAFTLLSFAKQNSSLEMKLLVTHPPDASAAAGRQNPCR